MKERKLPTVCAPRDTGRMAGGGGGEPGGGRTQARRRRSRSYIHLPA
jgi:hypothetical protein